MELIACFCCGVIHRGHLIGVINTTTTPSKICAMICALGATLTQYIIRLHTIANIMLLYSPSCITAVITLLITLQTTASIVNWDLIYQSVDSHFAEAATDDITLTYMIGTQREYSIELYASDCETSITGMPSLNMVPTISQDYELDPLHDILDVVIDVDVTEITSSNIWDESNDTLEFCSVVHLLSGVEVIKEE